MEMDEKEVKGMEEKEVMKKENIVSEVKLEI